MIDEFRPSGALGASMVSQLSRAMWRLMEVQKERDRLERAVADEGGQEVCQAGDWVDPLSRDVRKELDAAKAEEDSLSRQVSRWLREIRELGGCVR